MNCPNCNHEIFDDVFCYNCDTDVIIISKILNISIRYYNAGLENARERNFSGAISSLHKSIYFDKYNIQARNLLGLIYFQVGHLADAVKQWIISTNISPENNIASGYIELFEVKIRDFEKLNDSVILYNQAIQFLKNGNEDLSIIRLKKALDINKGFIDAWNLLTLCYIKENKKDKAIDCIKKAYRLDPYNIKINYYLKILDIKLFGMNRRIKKEKKSVGISRYLGEFSSFTVGIVIMYVFYKIMIVPSYIEKVETEVSAVNQKYIAIQGAYNELKESENTQIIGLEKNVSDLKLEIEQLNNEKLIRKNKDSLVLVLELYNSNRISEAIPIFNLINSDGFDEQTMASYNDIKTKLISSQNGES